MTESTKVFTEYDLFCPEANEGRFIPIASMMDNEEELFTLARYAGFCQLRDTIQLREVKVTGRRDVRAISGGDAAQGQVIWRKDYANAETKVLRTWEMTRKGYQEVPVES